MTKNSDFLLPILNGMTLSSNKSLQSLTIRLLMNLAHDPDFRAQIVKHGFLDLFIKCFVAQSNAVLTVELLYLLSTDLKTRSLPKWTEIVPVLIRLILECETERVDIEIISLAINLGTVALHRNAIYTSNALKFLLRRAIKSRDPLLFKMLRNVSQDENQDIKLQFVVLTFKSGSH